MATKTQTQASSPRNFSLAPIMFGLGFFFMLVLAYFGGIPEDVPFAYFIAGISVMVGVGALITFFAWYMLFRPLPANYARIEESPVSPATKQFIGLAMVMGMSLTIMGAVWDELWHQTFGIPFGEDLFWRPHLMMYVGLLSMIVIAAITAFLMIRGGRGVLAQRLRADSYLGLVLVIGLFFAYSLPADPVWHIIYGDDITAFSIPHVLLGFSLAITQIVGAGIILQTEKRDEWQGLQKFELRFLIPLLALAFGFLALAMVFVTTFVRLTPEEAALSPYITSLPIWLLPAFLVTIPTFMGTIANHSIRRVGAATIMLLIALGIRFALAAPMGIAADHIYAWFALIPAAVGLDIAAAVQVSRGKQPNWWINLCGVIAMLPITILVMGQYYQFPEVTVSNFIQFMIFPSLIAVVFVWIGTATGDYIVNQQQAYASEARVSTQRLTGLAIAAYAILLIFTAVYFVTATPPVVEVATLLQ